MEGFHYRGGVLYADEVPVECLVANVGTPTYIYCAGAIRSRYRRLAEAFSPLGARLHYAVKASGNLHLLRLLRSLGAGMDVVSIGELERAWLAGTPMNEIVFAGVGKTDDEICAMAMADMESFLPGVTEQVRHTSVTRRVRALPNFKCGMFDKVRQIEGMAGEIEGLHLAGDYLKAPLCEGAVRSGFAAADAIQLPAASATTAVEARQ